MFFKLQYANKWIDAANKSNILYHKKVQFCIPPYFKITSTPCISYNYTSTIASKLLNYKHTLQILNIEHPPTCSCYPSPYKYTPAGHVITSDVNLVSNENLRSLIMEGPKLKEPRSFTWRHISHITNSVEDYAKRWAKSEKEEIDTLSEWI